MIRRKQLLYVRTKVKEVQTHFWHSDNTVRGCIKGTAKCLYSIDHKEQLEAIV